MTLPTWTVLLLLLPFAAAFELRQGRPRPFLVWLSVAVAVVLAINGLAAAPGEVGTGLAILLLGVAWGAAVLAALAALERLPGAIRGLGGRGDRTARRERARGGVRAADPSRV